MIRKIRIVTINNASYRLDMFGRIVFIVLIISLSSIIASGKSSIPILETGGRTMPKEWIDKDTGHRIRRLVDGNRNYSFYFTNNPFWDGNMLYTKYEDNVVSTWSINLKNNSQKCIIKGHHSEVFCRNSKSLFIQTGDSLLSVNVQNSRTSLVAVKLPKNFELQSVNSSGTLVVGFLSDPREIALAKIRKDKNMWMKASYDSCLIRSIYIIDVNSGKGKIIYKDAKWINHIQFSPSNPQELMFCHEGDWTKVDRIWTLNIDGGKPILMHKRSVDREACGHEMWAPNGKFIYYDLQIPPGTNPLYIGCTNVYYLSEFKYTLNRQTWSLHYRLSNDLNFFVGDGSSYFGQDKAWLYYYKISSDNMLKAKKLVNMKYQNYKLEPNAQPTPDGKYVIFMANFEGYDSIYEVEI